MTNGTSATAGSGTGATARQRLPMTPGRRFTLVLGVPVVLAFIVATGFSGIEPIGSASFPVSYDFPAGNGQLTTQVAGGGITVEQQAALKAPVLTGIAHYTLKRSTFTHSGDTVSYHCPWDIGNCELNATLKMPATAPLSLATDGGDVSLPSFSRPVTLSTGGGDVAAGAVSGGLNLDSGSGDVSVTDLTGPPATLDSGGGDVTITTLATAGASTVNSASGDVAIADLASSGTTVSSGGGDVSIEGMTAAGTTIVNSASGDVSVTCTSPPKDLQITSGGGDVSIVLPPGSYAFNTSADGGDISEPTSDPQAKDQINVQSDSGDISISEAS
jgi:hypothetical protein